MPLYKGRSKKSALQDLPKSVMDMSTSYVSQQLKKIATKKRKTKPKASNKRML